MAGKKLWVFFQDISEKLQYLSAVEDSARGAVEWLFGQWAFLLLASVALLVLTLHFHRRNTGFNEPSELGILFSLAKTAYKRKHRDKLMEVITKRWKKSWNTRNEQGTGLTLFLCSCLCGERKVVEHLLSKGADINSVSSEGDTPLILATYACCTVKGADPTILDLLACRGVEVNAQNSNGDSPLSISALYGRPDLLSLLLQYGADVNMVGCANCLPVDFATYCGSQESIRLLNEHMLQSGQ